MRVTRKFLVILAAGLLTGIWSSPASKADFVNFETPQVHPIDLSPDGTQLAVCNTADNRIELFDVTSGLPSLIVSIPVGLEPVSVRFRSTNEVWVVNQVSDSVSVINLTSQVVRATLPTRDEPADVVFAGSPQRAYVSCARANIVHVFDPTNLIQPPVDVPIEGESPRAMAVSPDGLKVYVAIFESGNGSTILGGGAAVTNGLAFPPNIVSDPVGPYGGVNPPPNAPGGFSPALNPNNPAPPPVGLIVKKDAGGNWHDDNGTNWTAWVSGASAPASGRPVGWDLIDHDVAILDTANTNFVKYVDTLMNLCMAIGVNPQPGNERVTVVGTDGINQVRFEPNIGGRFLRVNIALFDPANTNATKIVKDLNPHLVPYSTSTIPQTDRNRSIGDPRAIAWRLNGTRGYVAGMGSDNVIVLDSNGNRSGVVTNITVDAGPTGLAIDEARNKLYILNRFAGSVSVVDLATETQIAAVSFFDPTPPVIGTGRPHLYNTHRTSGLGHISCASCHIDARIDRLAWDLGNPAGTVKPIDPNVHNLGGDFPGLTTGFTDFHPMKGPMTTQTLQDIIGNEPHHWRGDRDGLEQFNPAFVSLLGDDTQLTTNEMQEFEDFLGTIHFPPNPFRTLTNTLPTNLPLPGQFTSGRFGPPGQPLPNGDAQRALDTIYRPRSRGIDGGAFACVTCHTLPVGIGTDTKFSVSGFTPIPPGPNGEHHHAMVSVDGSTQRAFKTPQLRNMYEKVGFETTKLRSRAGFGFAHDGGVDSLARFVSEPVFTTMNDQEVADLVALMLSFSGSDFGPPVDSSEPPGGPSHDAHAAVGRQVTKVDATSNALLTQLLALADVGAVDVIAKSAINKMPRGWQYVGSGLFQTDQSCGQETLPQVLGHAGLETPVTFTVVPAGSGRRMGVDRNENGLLDFDEASGLFRMVSVAVQGNDMLVSWTTPGGMTNRVQATSGGSFTNTFTDLSPMISVPCGQTATNYLDPGAVTNKTARFYRVRLVP